MDGLCGRLAQKKEHRPNGWCSFLVTRRGFEPRTRRRKRHAHSRGGNVSPALRTAATAGHDSGPGFSYIESYAKIRHANACRFSGDPAGIRTPDPLLKRQLLCRLSYRIRVKHLLPINHRPRGRIHGQWQGRLDSNQRMRESKSLALPLGYAPKWKKRGDRGYPGPLLSGVGDGTRTHNTWNHNPVLCQLNYTHHI